MSEPERAFELRAGMQLVPSLHLHVAQPPAFRERLLAEVERAPGMFREAPMVLDLQGLPEGEALPDFAALEVVLRAAAIVPVGVRNATAAQKRAARAAGWAVLPDARERPAPMASTTPASAARPRPEPARVIEQPVRSGQQIFAAGDLILLGPVSAGAEVLAEGCIHAYGALRGRALAGVAGDTGARIFCLALHAELISIAGHYQVLEDLEPGVLGQAIQVRLEQQALRLEPLRQPAPAGR